MPCSPEMRKKADAILDSIATRMDSVMSRRDSDKGGLETKECAIAGDSKKPDTQDEPGMLGKKNAS